MYRALIIVGTLGAVSFWGGNAHAAQLAERLSGDILLQVQAHGEAWYVNPRDDHRYFLGRPADAFAVIREAGIGISEKDIATIPVGRRTASLPAVLKPKVKERQGGASLARFASAAEFDAFVADLRKKQKKKTDENAKTGLEQYFGLSAKAAAEAPTASSAESITNVQEQGVDEGDIVKAYKDYLIVLRRGRLFTVRTTAGATDTLVPVAVLDVPRETGEDVSAWYDEMLVSGSTIIVIGYRYGVAATELNLFTINDDGSLVRGQTYFFDSSDYYSSQNYTGRLMGDTLVFTMPYYPSWYGLDKRPDMPITPSMRQWLNKGILSAPTPLVEKTAIAKPLHDDLYPTLHTIVLCKVTQELSCTGKALVGPASRAYYVSQNAVYLWVNDTALIEPLDDPANGDEKDPQSSAFIYRIDLATGDASGLLADGSPVDQFSFQEKNNELRVFVQNEGSGDAMWNTQASNGSVALLRTPLSEFSADPHRVASDAFTPLPEPKGGDLQNRFVGDMLLYGMQLPFYDRGIGISPLIEGITTQTFLHVKNVTNDDSAKAIKLSHRIDRIDVLGADAIVVGISTSENALQMSVIDLTQGLSVKDTLTLPNTYEVETRSHGFFFHPYDSGGGVMGLPIQENTHDVTYRVERVPVLFVRLTGDKKLEKLGTLYPASDSSALDDRCVASCVDWYGNARPVFYRDRMFALSGYDLIEGRIDANQISKVRETSLLSPITR